MKKITLSILFILTVIFATNTVAQTTRYLDPVFSSVDDTVYTVYGVNYSVMVPGYVLPTGTEIPGVGAIPTLNFQFFEPTGDTEQERPLIIYLHTGTFGPIIRNGNPTGSKDYDWSTQVFCNNFAARGYVVANTEYRLGWNPYLPTEPERASSLMKAAYRGIQDVKSAIRFFRKSYEEGNPYGIDTSRIIICGQGTGGWIATCLNSVDKVSELQLPKFLAGDGTPLIDTAVLGDWDGFGGVDTINISNHPGYSSEHDMVLNMGGAIGDISWLNAGDKPIAAVHGNLDAVATFTTGNLSVSSVNIVSDISGSHDVIKKANMLGNNSSISNLFDPYSVAAKQAYSALVGSMDFGGAVINETHDNLFPFNTGNPGEGAPWDYWDSATVVYLATAQGLPDSVGVQAHLSGLQTNPDMSQEKALAYIDSTVNFFCPRMVNALMLPGNNVGIDLNDVVFNTYPNPTTDFISFNSSNSISEISIFDNNGKVVRRYNPNLFSFTVDLSDLPKGIYISEVKTTNKIHSEKIILK
jgi:hypothetical protein